MTQAGLAAPLRDLRDTWDRIVDSFLAGGRPYDETLRPWFDAYRGTNQSERQDDALPEPYHGSFDPPPKAVVLSINPGLAYLGEERWRDHDAMPDLQSRNGRFASEIRQAGSFAEWARQWQDWRELTGGHPNPFVTSRVNFVRAWCHPTEVANEEVLWFDLYPWHSRRWGGLTWSSDVNRLIQRFILEPIAALGGVPAFAFGSPWIDVFEHLGLRAELTLRGSDIGPDVAPSRVVYRYRRDPNGPTVVVMKHQGGAGPPKSSEVPTIRGALEAGSPPAQFAHGPFLRTSAASRPR